MAHLYWTPEREALLARRWKEGISGSQIAKELGGVTRNAVIGKVHRMGLSGRVTPSHPIKKKKTRGQRAAIGKVPKTVKPRYSREVKATQREKAETAPEPKRIALEDLKPGQCKWSVTDGEPHLFCGHDVNPGSNYCAHHTERAKGENRKPKTKAYKPSGGARITSAAILEAEWMGSAA